MNTFRRSIAVGGLVLSVGMGLPVLATAADALPQSVVVSYDVNAVSKDQAERLYSRLQTATKQVCAPYIMSHSDQFAAKRACYRQVLARAVQQVKSSDVAELHARAMRGGDADMHVATGGAGTSKLSK
jgi:UrcA family protein